MSFATRLRRRVLPEPLLTLALTALWLALERDYGVAQWLVAIVLGVVAPLLTRSLRPMRVRMHRPRVAIRLFFTVGRDVLVSNWRVLRATLAPRGRVPRGGFVTVPLDLRDPHGLAALAAIMCVIPGTVWSELAIDRSALLVHVFDLHDMASEVALIKERYEKPLIRIFQED